MVNRIWQSLLLLLQLYVSLKWRIREMKESIESEFGSEVVELWDKQFVVFLSPFPPEVPEGGNRVQYNEWKRTKTGE